MSMWSMGDGRFNGFRRRLLLFHLRVTGIFICIIVWPPPSAICNNNTLMKLIKFIIVHFIKQLLTRLSLYYYLLANRFSSSVIG